MFFVVMPNGNHREHLGMFCIVMPSIFVNCPAVICLPNIASYLRETPLVICGSRSYLLHTVYNTYCNHLFTVPYNFYCFLTCYTTREMPFSDAPNTLFVTHGGCATEFSPQKYVFCGAPKMCATKIVEFCGAPLGCATKI